MEPVLSPLLSIADEATVPKVYKADVSVAFDNDCDEFLIRNIKKAEKTIYGAIYSFTNKDIAESLIERAGMKVKIILKLDKKQNEFAYTKFLIKKMKKAGIEVKLIDMREKSDHMHHKFAVIDEKIVVTGSFNWTRNASENNHENIISIKSENIAAEFIKAWKKVGK